MTTHRPHRLSLTCLAALALAGCQSTPPAGPVAPAGQVAPAVSPALAAFHRFAGLPERLAQPPAAEPAAATGFSLAQAADNLFGLETAVSTAAGSQEFIDVVYNPNAKNYLAVWHDFRNGTDGSNSDLYAQLIGPSGLLVGAALPIVSTAGMQLGPRVAYNAVSRDYLVAWTDNRAGHTDVYAQRFSAAGAAVGAATIVASGTSNQMLAGLAYNNATNEYLLTWTDDRLGYNTLEAGRLTALNAKVGTDLTVSNTPGALSGGDVATNGTNDYIVAWADARTTGPGIYTRRLTSAGASGGTAVTVASGAGYEYNAPKLAYSNTAAGFLLVYDRRATATGAADVYGVRLTSAGAASAAPFAITTAAGDQVLPNVRTNTSDGMFLVAWTDGRDGNEDLDVYAKVYTGPGAVHLNDYVVSNQASVQAVPVITFDSTKKHFLIAWQDGRAHATQGYDLYAQRTIGAPMTAQDAADELFEEFINVITTTAGGAGGAQSQLENAIDKLADGKDNNAITHLENFIDKLPGLVNNAVITADEAVQLEALAQNVIDQIRAGNT